MSYLSLPTYIISQFGLFCISTHPTTFFSVLSNFLTSVVSCVTHSLGCEVVSRVSGSLSLFATCTLAFSIHLYAFSTVRLLPSPPPPPPNSFVRSSFGESIVRSFVRRIALPRCLLFFVVDIFFFLTFGLFSLLWLVLLVFFSLVCTSLTCSTSLL